MAKKLLEALRPETPTLEFIPPRSTCANRVALSKRALKRGPNKNS
jgi:hypothetical protein